MISVGASAAGAGVALGPEAPFRAITQALAGLEGRKAGLVLFFAAASLEPRLIVEQAVEAAAGAPLAGMTSAGEISAEGPVEGGCCALAFDTSMEVGIGVGGRAFARPPRRRAGGSVRGVSTTRPRCRSPTHASLPRP